jgi:fatty-acyl-CoA synthase
MEVPQPVWVRSPGTSDLFIPNVAVSLRGASAAVGRADQDGWFRTGDLGHLDRAGRLVLSGREDDLVKVDGKRVALGEVAGCLESSSKVREAEAHLGHDQFGVPIVTARVVAATPCRAEELIEYCARNLAPYKVPRQIDFCESL